MSKVYRMRLLGSVIVFGVLLVTMPASAASDTEVHAQIQQILGNADALDEPMLTIRNAIANHDPESLAEFSEFPLRNSGEDVQGPEELADRFDELFTDDVKAALAGFQYSDLIVSSDGVGLGNGAVWMNLICEDDACNSSHWAVVSINN